MFLCIFADAIRVGCAEAKRAVSQPFIGKLDAIRVGCAEAKYSSKSQIKGLTKTQSVWDVLRQSLHTISDAVDLQTQSVWDVLRQSSHQRSKPLLKLTQSVWYVLRQSTGLFPLVRSLSTQSVWDVLRQSRSRDRCWSRCCRRNPYGIYRWR